MLVHYGFEEAKNINNAVVTTGSFDGVHIGHKTIINRINEIAKSIGGESVLITFYPHPRKVLYPETQGKDLMFINSQKEKIELLGKTGLDHLVIVNFTLEFSRVSSQEFIRNFLVAKLNAKYIVVGFNHHFGHNREGDYGYLYKLKEELGFNVEEIPEQDIQHETVSSTTIRRAIKEGRVQRANAYLDHKYIIIGSLGKGTHHFTNVGFPTLNIQIEEVGKLIPPTGIYATSLEWNNLNYKAMLVVWADEENDISHLQNQFVEIHILDFDNQFPDGDATIYFQKQISVGININNPSKLKHQLSQGQKAIDELIY
ncbi:MAG: riboflavin biosynthesis protein RibF [Bacteroidales bacterium]|nr:riboflavin biosynthesis protein RibF [Bacteroidales bacterium]